MAPIISPIIMKNRFSWDDWLNNHTDNTIAITGITGPKGILYCAFNFLFLKTKTEPAVDINSIKRAITVRLAKNIKFPYNAKLIVIAVVNKIANPAVPNLPFLLKTSGTYLLSAKAWIDLGAIKESAIVIPPIQTSVAIVINKNPELPNTTAVAEAMGTEVTPNLGPNNPIHTTITIK